MFTGWRGRRHDGASPAPRFSLGEAVAFWVAVPVVFGAIFVAFLLAQRVPLY